MKTIYITFITFLIQTSIYCQIDSASIITDSDLLRSSLNMRICGHGIVVYYIDGKKETQQIIDQIKKIQPINNSLSVQFENRLEYCVRKKSDHFME